MLHNPSNGIMKSLVFTALNKRLYIKRKISLLVVNYCYTYQVSCGSQSQGLLLLKRDVELLTRISTDLSDVFFY